MHKLGRWVFARICRVEPLLVREDDQRIRLDQVGHQRTEGIVVTEFDFVRDHGIVFIDHGNHAKAQQRQQGRARIEVALTISQIGVGEQHLCAAHALLAQLGLVHLRQSHLPHRRSSLQFVDFLGARSPAQALHAFRNRTAGHHHHFAWNTALAAHERSQLATPFADGGFIKAAPLVGH